MGTRRMPGTQHEPESAAVVRWRQRRLTAAGFSPAQADAAARDERADVHALIELAGRGCPPDLALRILAPLDDARAE
jgi:hypothetical protein